jgi:type I restriction enzyme, S subunit
MALNQDVKAITPKEGIHPVYLAYSLKVQESRAMGWADSTTHGTLRLTTEMLRELPIRVPSIKEQERIVEAISSWDRALAEIDAMIEAKQTRLKGLRQRLLTGDVRFPGFSEPWREVRLGDLTREVRERNEGVYTKSRVYGVTNKDGVTENTTRAPSDDLERYKIVPPDGFAYNPMRLDVGSIGRVMTHKPVLVSGDYVAFSCSEGKLIPNYMSHFQQTHRWSHFVERQGSGSVRVRIYYHDLARMKMDIPPSVNEQQKIASFLDSVQHEIDQLRALREARARQKKGMMQRLLLGEVRV